VNWQPDAHRSVLLVHDMQRYFLRPYHPQAEALTGMIATITTLLREARRLDVPVVYTAQPGGQSVSERGLLIDMWGTGLPADPAMEEILPEIAPTDKDTVLRKHRYSAFHRTPLRELMAGWGRDQLIITGVYASIGLATTAADAFSQGVQAFLVADGVADFSTSDHERGMYQVARTSGVVLPGTHVASQWEHSVTEFESAHAHPGARAFAQERTTI
jgi:bifunctional isochorismate lyase/aryl carrier protein